MTYYSERIQRKIKRKGAWGKVERKPRAVAKRQGSHQSFQQFQKNAGKNWSSELQSFLKEGSYRDVTPNSSDLEVFDKFLKYTMQEAEKQSRKQQNK